MKHLLPILTVALLATGCTRITTGEVGLRVNASREIQGAELQPGSWNQTIIGSVLTFPVRDIPLTLNDMKPMTAENSALADFDLTAIYAINPSSVSDLYSNKSKAFHLYDAEEKDTILMARYVETIIRNSAYKAVREYESLKVADNRQEIERKIKEYAMETLKGEKLDTALTITTIQIRNILPPPALIDSANARVKAENELKVKETEVKIAEAESRRMKALSENSGQSIAYMNAQANQTIANAIAGGKVNTILIPHGMNVLNMPK